MRSAECPDAVLEADQEEAPDFTLRAPAGFGLQDPADFAPAVDFGPQDLADFVLRPALAQAAPVFALQVRPGEPVASPHLLPRAVRSHRELLHRAGTSSSTVHLDFAALVTGRSFTDVLDASRLSCSEADSLGADSFWDLRSIPIIRITRVIRITQGTTTGLRPSRLS